MISEFFKVEANVNVNEQVAIIIKLVEEKDKLVKWPKWVPWYEILQLINTKKMHIIYRCIHRV